jgi:hypothetical protein
MGSCPRVLAALADCQKKHARSKDADVRRHALTGRTIALEQQICCLTLANLSSLPAAAVLCWTHGRSWLVHLQGPVSCRRCVWDGRLSAAEKSSLSHHRPTTDSQPPPLLHAAVRAIEDCIGISNSSGRAPIIPAKCADRAALLEACLEAQQEVAESKTGTCGGAQPIPKPAAAS